MKRALLFVLLVACKKPPPPDPLAVPSSLPLAVPSLESSVRETPALRVYVTKKDILVGDKKVASIDDLGPLAAAVPKGETTALVYVDRETPYGTLFGVLPALTKADVTRFDLVVQHDATYGVLPIDAPDPCAGFAQLQRLETSHVGALLGSSSAMPAPAPPPPPKACPPVDPTVRRLAPAVLVTRDGFSVFASGEHLAPGCASPGAGLTIAGRDYAALERCLRAIHTAEVANEKRVVVSADAATSVQTVAETIGTTRKIFPETALGMMR